MDEKSGARGLKTGYVTDPTVRWIHTTEFNEEIPDVAQQLAGSVSYMFQHSQAS